jgi:hypothetical protein
MFGSMLLDFGVARKARSRSSWPTKSKKGMAKKADDGTEEERVVS